MHTVSERFKVSPFFVFYTISSVQIGIGILQFQRNIAKEAGYDAWISVILAGIGTHIILWMIYSILQKTDSSIVEINERLFGKLIGKTLNLLIALYYLALVVIVVRTFIQVIQTWMFPDLETWVFATAFVLLCIYVILGGFRAIVGVCFFGIVLPGYLIFTLVYTFENSRFYMLLPLFDHSIVDIIKATKEMTFPVLGFESLLVYYPFVKNPEQSKKWGHLALLMTTAIYLAVAIVTFGFYSEKQLQNHMWPTLSMWTIVEMPFLERFEYLGIANWTLIILPNACLSLWCASRVIKLTIKVSQKYVLIALSAVCVVISSLLQTRESIEQLGMLIGNAGFYLLYGFIPLVFVLSYIVRKARNTV